MLPRDWNSFGSPYDTRSLMHYEGRAFSRNGEPTIIDRLVNIVVDFFRQRSHQLQFLQPGLHNHKQKLEKKKTVAFSETKLSTATFRKVIIATSNVDAKVILQQFWNSFLVANSTV